ncbi:MAG: hypothetical protein PHT02_00660 [Tissierellia bacterium]|nr:hypothetical protein [Tissierellia bacterium]
MSYRKDLDRVTVYAEECDIDKTEFVKYEDAKDIIIVLKEMLMKLRINYINIKYFQN